MMRLVDRIREEEGFSAAELLFASMLGLMVMTVSYLMFETAMKAFRQVEVQTTASNTAMRTSQWLSRPIREMQPPTTSSDYEIVFLADISGDDEVMEWVRYHVPAGSTRLLEETRAAQTGAATGTPRVVADNIQNRQLSVPLFTYYSDPASAPLAPEYRRAGTKVIRLVVLTRGPGLPEPPVYRLQTDVFLRNVNR